jgi:hypothetical protein
MTQVTTKAQLFHILLPSMTEVKALEITCDSDRRLGSILTMLNDLNANKNSSGLNNRQVTCLHELMNKTISEVIEQRINCIAMGILNAHKTAQFVPALLNYSKLYKINISAESLGSVDSLIGFFIVMYKSLNLKVERLKDYIPQRHLHQLNALLKRDDVSGKTIEERLEAVFKEGLLGDPSCLFTMTKQGKALRDIQRLNPVGSYPAAITLFYNIIRRRKDFLAFIPACDIEKYFKPKQDHNAPTDVTFFEFPEIFASIEWWIKALLLRHRFRNWIPMVQRFVITASNLVPSLLHLGMKYYYALNYHLRNDAYGGQPADIPLSTALLKLLGESGIQTFEVFCNEKPEIIRFKIVSDGKNLRIVKNDQINMSTQGKQFLKGKLHPDSTGDKQKQTNEDDLLLPMLYAYLQRNMQDFRVALTKEQRETVVKNKDIAIAELVSTLGYAIISNTLMQSHTNPVGIIQRAMVPVDIIQSAMVMSFSYHTTYALSPKNRSDEDTMDTRKELIRFIWSVITEGTFLYLSSELQSVSSLCVYHITTAPIKTMLSRRLTDITFSIINPIISLRNMSWALKTGGTSVVSKIKPAEHFGEFCKLVSSQGMMNYYVVGFIEFSMLISPTYQEGGASTFNRLFVLALFCAMASAKGLYKKESTENTTANELANQAIPIANNGVSSDLREKIQKIKRCTEWPVIYLVGFALFFELLIHTYESSVPLFCWNNIVAPMMLTELYNIPIAFAQHGLIHDGIMKLGAQIGQLKLTKSKED